MRSLAESAPMRLDESVANGISFATGFPLFGDDDTFGIDLVE